MSEQEVLSLIRERLSKLFPIRRLILFGSRARGSAAADSAYDVLVVVDTEIPFIERQGRALLALGRRSFAVDLLVYTDQEAAKEAAVPGSAVYWAFREGREFRAV